MYSSDSNPIELTGDVDLEFLKKQVCTLLHSSRHSGDLVSDYALPYSPLYTILTDVLFA
jgi:hypothetical protein